MFFDLIFEQDGDIHIVSKKRVLKNFFEVKRF